MTQESTPAVPQHPAAGRPPRLALIGCGAVSENVHLPALATYPGVLAELICVDADIERARAVARRVGAHSAAANHLDVLPSIDGAIVAVPPKLHYDVALDCVQAGIHVLCEKPLAETSEQARALVARADSASVQLCVNNLRRLYPSAGEVRARIRSGALGVVRRIDFLWGEEFDWPAASGAYFGLASGGRGALMDKGSHVLDLICWWLGAKPEILSYQDDSLGGSEAVAALRFRHGECEGEVRLSWLSRYANTFEVHGDDGRVEGRLYDWNELVFARRGGSRERLRLRSHARGLKDFSRQLLNNFLDVVRGLATPVVAGRDVLDSIDLMEECYAARGRFDMPWYDSWRRLAH